jgi:hypothetical protein
MIAAGELMSWILQVKSIPCVLTAALAVLSKSVVFDMV